MADGADQALVRDGEPRPAAERLREVDLGTAQFANRLHRLIALAPGFELLRGCHRRDADTDRLVFADPAGLMWQPAAEELAEAHDLDAQMALLVAYEDTLDALEQAIGMRFAPEAVTTHVEAEALWIELLHEGRRFALGFGPALIDQEALRLPAQEPRPARVPAIANLSFRAAAIALADVEALSPGALIALPGGTLDATVETRDELRHIAGRWDPHTGALHGAHPQGANRMNDPSADGPQPGLHVPLTVALPEIAVPAADIEALAEGGTVTLGPLAEGLEAHLLVAGRPIAQGEIVRLGDSFAFMVDRMIVRSSAAAPRPAPAQAESK